MYQYNPNQQWASTMPVGDWTNTNPTTIAPPLPGTWPPPTGSQPVSSQPILTSQPIQDPIGILPPAPLDSFDQTGSNPLLSGLPYTKDAQYTNYDDLAMTQAGGGNTFPMDPPDGNIPPPPDGGNPPGGCLPGQVIGPDGRCAYPVDLPPSVGPGGNDGPGTGDRDNIEDPVVVGDPENGCPPGYKMATNGTCIAIGKNTGGDQNTGPSQGGNPDLGGQQPPYQTVLPDVSPYDVSQSPDPWSVPTDVGGVSAVNPQANQFAYDDIYGFADSAWQNAMRYLEPQMNQMDDRFAQDLINKGIDPYSEAGQEAFRQKSMQQNDMLSKSAFDALGFGAGLQNQMFGQDATRAGLANQVLQAQMGLGQRGHEFDTQAGMNANQQAFGQMMGLEGLNYRDYMTFVDQQRYQDSLALALAGLAPGPNYSQVSTGMPQAPFYEYGSDMMNWGNLFGS